MCFLWRRVCSQHGQALLAFNIYDWMRTPAAQGGAGLRPTVFTYTAAMRAALAGNLIDRALKVSIPLPTSALLCTPALSWALQHRVNGAAPVCTTTMAHHDCRRLHGDRLHSQGAQVLEGFHVMRLTDCDGGLYAVYMCCLVAQVWEDAVAAGCDPDSRMCTTLLEVCTRKGDTKRALGMYERMRDAPAGSRLSPSVHAFVSAMRAAADSGAWEKALSIWDDMVAANCQPTGARMCPRPCSPTAWVSLPACYLRMSLPLHKQRTSGKYAKIAKGFATVVLDIHVSDVTIPRSSLEKCLKGEQDLYATVVLLPAGHAYAAAISACAVGSAWPRAVQLFDEMRAANIQPDVVSCTALISALGADGQWQRAETVIRWMHEVDGFLSPPSKKSCSMSRVDGCMRGKTCECTTTGISTPLWTHCYWMCSFSYDGGTLALTVISGIVAALRCCPAGFVGKGTG